MARKKRGLGQPMLKKVLSSIGVILTIAALLGAAFGVDSRFAKAEPTKAEFSRVAADISALNDRIDVIKLEDQLAFVKSRIFGLEDRWGEKFKREFDRYHNTIDELLAFMPEEYREEYRTLVATKISLETQILKKNKTT